MFKAGDKIIYRAIAGTDFPGVVTGVPQDGFVDLAISLKVPSDPKPWPLRMVRTDRVRFAENQQNQQLPSD